MIEQVGEMNTKDILIARRWSKLEHDAQRLHKTEKEMIAEYRKLGLEERMMGSHKRQMESLNFIRKAIGEVEVVAGTELTQEVVERYVGGRVIALGGDGHFSFVSHFITDQTIIGVNADSEKSTGALLEFTPESLVESGCLKTGSCPVEQWTRMQVILDGKVLATLPLADVYIGAKLSVDMSRYVVEFEGKQEEQKTSGLLVATGTGSTGWYSKMFQTIYQNRDDFSRTDPGARFIVREEPGFDTAYFGEDHPKLSRYDILKGRIAPDSQLIIHSLTDEGIVSIDSYRDLMFDFNRGATVQIFPSDKPLSVLKAAA